MLVLLGRKNLGAGNYQKFLPSLPVPPLKKTCKRSVITYMYMYSHYTPPPSLSLSLSLYFLLIFCFEVMTYTTIHVPTRPLFYYFIIVHNHRVSDATFAFYFV